MRTFQRDADSLPPDMCCPFVETEGIEGISYSSTVKGCCGGKIYDLSKKHCCKNNNVIPLLNVQQVPKISNVNANGEGSIPNSISAEIKWSIAQYADTYEFDVSSARNSTWTQPASDMRVTGLGDSMGLSITIANNLLVGYSYDFKVRAKDCLDRYSEWDVQTVEIRSAEDIKIL